MSGAALGAAIGSVVPGLGTAIGGAVGAAYDIADASGALDWLGKHLLGSGGAAVAQKVIGAAAAAGAPTAAAVSGLSPEARAALTVQLQTLAVQADQQQRQADLDTLRATLADVASARGQTVDLTKAGSAVAWGAPAVSLVVLVTFGLVMWLTITRQLPTGSEGVLNVLLGMLGTGFASVTSYWLGSSASSAQKNALLAASMPAPR